jgi:hypothetical protein
MWYWIKSVYLLRVDLEEGLLLIVESGVSLGDLWVKSMNLFWGWILGSWGTGRWGGSSSIGSSVGSWLGIHHNVLIEMEFVALHGDILTHVLVSVHTGGEVLVDRDSACSSEEQSQNKAGLFVHFDIY